VIREASDPSAARRPHARTTLTATSPFVLCADLDDSLIKAPSRAFTTLVRLGTRELAELAELAEVQVAGWLGRLITRQVDVEPMLPYRTEGATALFFGRDHELRRLIGPGCRRRRHPRRPPERQVVAASRA